MRNALLIAAATAAACSAAAGAASVASDVASNTPYDDGWDDGDNGGFGFVEWDVSPDVNINQSGVFIGDATTNGNSATGGGPLGEPPDDINTSGESFGLYANSGQVAEAVRPFNGPLVTGDLFEVNIDTGFVDSGGTVGLALQNAAGANLVEFFLIGGDSNYTVNDADGPMTTSVPFTQEGLSLDFTLTDADSYELNIFSFDGDTDTVTGDLIGNADQAVTRLRLFNANAGAGDDHNFFANSLAITPVPEPVTVLGGVSLLSLVVLRRRK